MALSLLRPFGGTFFNFSDYMRPAIRLAAIMELPVIYIFTHDSIGVGEDGPTHQPVEQLISLRTSHTPIAFALSRQALPTIDRSKYAGASGLAKGAYVLGDCEGTPQVILIGTGSEVQ